MSTAVCFVTHPDSYEAEHNVSQFICVIPILNLQLPNKTKKVVDIQIYPLLFACARIYLGIQAFKYPLKIYNVPEPQLALQSFLENSSSLRRVFVADASH